MALSIQRINSELCHLTNEEGRTLSNSLKFVATNHSEFLAQTTRKLGPLEGCQEKLQHIAKSPGSATYPQVMKSLRFRRKGEHGDLQNNGAIDHHGVRRGNKRKRQEGEGRDS